MTAPDLVGVSEIALRAAVRPDTVQKWRARHPGFPPPIARLTIGPVWEWSAVRRWLDEPRRAGRPSKTPADG